MLLAKIDAYFAPARERRKALRPDPAKVEAVLKAAWNGRGSRPRKTMAMGAGGGGDVANAV